ncbi:unnamed protein product [Nippostrongylus brasiliensis]|uniref:Uncharacterized protein n=1 Tax=Nippostrongylus brasiliensis TaxID=27835 RepID=A0A0N4YDE3_NIPBR|nr:unnamed protein product [Nippostrongylus brasiliensis]
MLQRSWTVLGNRSRQGSQNTRTESGAGVVVDIETATGTRNSAERRRSSHKYLENQTATLLQQAEYDGYDQRSRSDVSGDGSIS